MVGVHRELAPDVIVLARDWFGIEHRVRALSGPEPGRSQHRRPIIWLDMPVRSGGTEPTPWPVEDVRVAPDDASHAACG